MAKGTGIFAAIGVGTVISAIAGTYKVSEFIVKAKRLHEVGRENEVFARLIRRIHADLEETRRLVRLPEVEYALSTAPEKVAWINSVMKSTRGALERMQPYVEPIAEDTEEGKHVGLRHRMWWVLDTKEKLVNHNLELVAVHQSLMQVLGLLSAMEPLACCMTEEEKQQRVLKTREIDVEFERKRDVPRDWRFERRREGGEREVKFEAEVRREGGPREVKFEAEARREGGPRPRGFKYEAEVRREGGPQDFQYEAEVRREGPPQDFQYQADVRREGPPQDFEFRREVRREDVPQDFRYEREVRRGPAEFQYKAEVRRNGGQEEWIEERDVRREQKDYYTPDPRDVPRMTTWPRSRL